MAYEYFYSPKQHEYYAKNEDGFFVKVNEGGTFRGTIRPEDFASQGAHSVTEDQIRQQAGHLDPNDNPWHQRILTTLNDYANNLNDDGSGRKQTNTYASTPSQSKQTTVIDGSTYQVGSKAYNQVMANKSTASPTVASSTPALGTPEFTNYLVSQGSKLGMDLSKFSVPTKATGAQAGMSTPVIPNINMTPGDVSLANSTFGGLQTANDLQNQELARIQSEIDAGKSQGKGILAAMASAKFDSAKALAEFDERYGVSQIRTQKAQALSEYQTLNTEYANVKAALETEKMQQKNRMATTGFISRADAEVNDRYRPELIRLETMMNAKMSYMSVLNGDLNTAVALSDRAVQAMTADAKWKYDFLNTLRQENSDNLNRLESRYQKAMDSAVDLAKWQYEQGQAEARAKMGIIQDAAMQGVDLSAYANGSLADITAAFGRNAKNTFTSQANDRANRAASLDAQKTQAEISALRSSGSGSGTGSGITQGQAYLGERQTRIISSIDELLKKTNGQTVGILSIGRFVPGSIQRNYKADLETLKANISFSELQAMREASKTGGALGQVAVRELELLESTLGALDQGQSPSNMKKNLEKIKSSIARWDAARGGGSEESMLLNMGYTAEQIEQIKNAK